MKHIIKDNKGVSLIEVLISVMIAGIVFLVIMQSFVTSAELNSKAHSNQQATSAVQEVVEVFKANDIDKLLTEHLPATATVTSDVIWPPIADLPDRSKYDPELFTRYRYKSPSYRTSDGTTFDIAVELNPAAYSSVTSTGNVVANSNTKGIGRIEGIDGLENALIADEINSYDPSIIETFKYKIKDASIGNTLNLDNIRKIVTVDIDYNARAKRIKVTCTVTYECIGLPSDTPDPQTYIVYNGSFSLEDEGGDKWISGDTIYIMITPYTKKDELVINSNYVDPTIVPPIARPNGTKPLNIEIVRGIDKNNASDPSKCYNLVHIKMDEPVGGIQTFMNRSQGAGINKSGRGIYNDLSIVSNMQGPQGEFIDISDASLEGAIYQEENQELRYMDMTVWVFEEGTLTGGPTEWEIPTWEADTIIEIHTTKVVK